MLGNLGGWHLIVILAIVLLLFGAAKLPALARSVGQSTRIFKNEVKSLKDEEKPAPEEVRVEAATPPTPPKPLT